MIDERTPPDPLAATPREPAAVESVASSPAVQRFHSCRWRRVPDETSAVDCCSHRDVLPIAGTTGFDPQAWCPDCTFYKLRRTPKKRHLEDYRY